MGTDGSASLKLERYALRAPQQYEAVQVTAQNAQQLAVWCDGRVHYTNAARLAFNRGREPGAAVAEIPAWREGTEFGTWIVQVGDWVALDLVAARFEVWPDAKFRERFDRAG